MSLSAPCTTRSRIAGIERTRTLPPSFGISFLRAGSGTYVRLYEFVPNLLEECCYALRLDGRERDPVYSRSTVVVFGQRIGFAAAFPSCRRGRTNPRNAKSVQPSP